MPRFAKQSQPTGLPAPITTTSTSLGAPDAATFNEGPAWLRGPKGELWLLAMQNFVGARTFYEDGQVRDRRMIELTRAVAQEPDGPDWLVRFVPYLRTECFVRSASVVLAVEAANALSEPGSPLVRPGRGSVHELLVDAACGRADEPAEVLGYWQLIKDRPRTYPHWLRRGLARAAARLYDEFAVLRYDGRDRPIRMGDVLELVHLPTLVNGVPDQDLGSPSDEHPLPGPYRHALYQHVLDRRHGRKTSDLSQLAMIRSNQVLRQVPQGDRRRALEADNFTDFLRAGGFSWQDLAGWLQGPMDALAWTRVIPVMGYQALLMNLRNFDEAGVPDEVAERVAARLADPERVRKSRMFPYQLVTAHRAVQSLRWAYPLEKALQASLANVPRLRRPLILVDRSGSMKPSYSGVNQDGLSRADVASIFGAALALRAEDPTLVLYGTQFERVDVPRGGSLLKLVDATRKELGGTQTWDALTRFYDGHDQVLIITDEQADSPDSDAFRMYGFRDGVDPWPAYRSPVRTVADLERLLAPVACPMYTWNLAGYAPAHLPSGGRRFTFGGPTDNAFRAVEQLERGLRVGWPF